MCSPTCLVSPEQLLIADDEGIEASFITKRMTGIFPSSEEVRLANKKQTQKLKDRAPPQNFLVYLQDNKGGKT